eukprot:jgi/Mesvir1/15216/Mv06446-RA.1
MAGVVSLSCIQSCCQRQASFISDALQRACYDDCYQAAGWEWVQPDSTSVKPLPIIMAVLLLFLSALFSGLNLGLLALDKVGLQIVMESGSGKEREYAATIYPLRMRGNLLLVTLVLGGTLVNSCIAILLASVTSGILGLVVSTIGITFFGEIIPQALCARHGLYIGAHTVWIVKIFMFLFLPIAYPVSICLDKALGHEIATVYSREELLKLIEIQATDPHAQMESGLTRDDHALIAGALDYRRKCVKDVMTDISKVFMLEVSERLDFQTLYNIYKSGFTRIPVYEDYPQNMVGLLYAKDLILVDPDDEIEVRTILSFHGRDIRSIPEDTLLDAVFREFKSSYIHLFFSTRSRKDGQDGATGTLEPPNLQDGGTSTLHRPVSKSMSCRRGSDLDDIITGIITLEDVIEEMIQDEIVDETDVYVDMNQPNKRVKRIRREADNGMMDNVGFLQVLQHKRRMLDALSSQEVQAIR